MYRLGNECKMQFELLAFECIQWHCTRMHVYCFRCSPVGHSSVGNSPVGYSPVGYSPLSQPFASWLFAGGPFAGGLFVAPQYNTIQYNTKYLFPLDQSKYNMCAYKCIFFGSHMEKEKAWSAILINSFPLARSCNKCNTKYACKYNYMLSTQYTKKAVYSGRSAKRKKIHVLMPICVDCIIVICSYEVYNNIIIMYTI